MPLPFPNAGGREGGGGSAWGSCRADWHCSWSATSVAGGAAPLPHLSLLPLGAALVKSDP